MATKNNRVYILFAQMDDISFPVDAWNEACEHHDPDQVERRIEAAKKKHNTDNLRKLVVDLPSHMPDSLFFPRIDASECQVDEVPLLE